MLQPGQWCHHPLAGDAEVQVEARQAGLICKAATAGTMRKRFAVAVRELALRDLLPECERCPDVAGAASDIKSGVMMLTGTDRGAAHAKLEELITAQTHEHHFGQDRRLQRERSAAEKDSAASKKLKRARGRVASARFLSALKDKGMPAIWPDRRDQKASPSKASFAPISILPPLQKPMNRRAACLSVLTDTPSFKARAWPIAKHAMYENAVCAPVGDSCRLETVRA